MKTLTLLAAATLAATAMPALAQSTDSSWNGWYVAGHLGGTDPANDDGGQFAFDTNLDGDFNDTVRTSSGVDAFSPGFCGGAGNGRTPDLGCRDDKGGAGAGLRVGYDWQMGRWVFGVVGEVANHDARDSVTAFSTTPAFYTMTRDLERTTALRARIGRAFGADGGWLVYATAGAVRADIDNTFRTSNGTNAFTPTGDSEANGMQAGIGIERRVLEHLSFGLEYLRTRLQDDDYRVAVTQGTAPATNPFVLQNPGGTVLRRTDEDFDVGAVRLTVAWRF
jgi:outer membrane immunogenic protein